MPFTSPPPRSRPRAALKPCARIGASRPACIGCWTCSSARTTRAYARGMEPRTWRSCATSLSTSCGRPAINAASSGAANAPDGIPNILLNSSGCRPVNPDSLPCVEGLEAATPRHGPLDPEVVALDALLQVLGDIMDRHTRQEPVFPGRRDGGWVGPRTIGADPVRGQQRLLLQHLAEEALGGVQITLRREQEINRGAMLVDRPIQVSP